MKGITGNPVLDAYQRAVKPVSPAQSPERPRATPSQAQSHPAAKLSLSNEAKALASGAPSPGDIQKVESLKLAIKNGTFEVDSHKVAEALLSGSHEL